MNNRERFLAVCRFEKPDYIPIFAFPYAGGVSWGLPEPDRIRLVAEGMPAWVGDSGYSPEKTDDYYSYYLEAGGQKSWMRYWGTTGPVGIDFFPAEPSKGIQSVKRIEGEWEVIESETGAVTKQVLHNDVTYSMPMYVEYDVRDRQSWYFYRDRATPGQIWDPKRMDAKCRRYDGRTDPLMISAGGTWGGFLRNLMGPELAMTVLYDDPELAHEILDWHYEMIRKYTYPVIERLRPEIVYFSEDICYNHGMLISPKLFDDFCSPHYRETCELCADCGVTLMPVDSDGNIKEFSDIITKCGVNGLFPCEVKAGNDLFTIREKHQKLVLFGWLEKEVLNIGNTHLIKEEIMSKVPRLIKSGGYFPNSDHGIQPGVTFQNMCLFMTLLHDILGNPEGEFPRIRL
jgi:hypothetical protein